MVPPSYKIALNIGGVELKEEPTISYITYSYQEGISAFLKILAIASVLAVISIGIAYIIGIRKKDIKAILVTNIMIKTIVGVIWQIVYNCLYLGIVFYPIHGIDLEDTFTDMLLFFDMFVIIIYIIADVISEGLIYNKILKYKKHKGITVSIICNIGIIIVFILLSIIIGIIQNLIWIRGI